MKKIDLEQGSAEWIEYRRTRIGASDIPSIMRLSPYKTRATLLREKRSGESQVLDDYTKAIFERGHQVEAQVREKLGAEWVPCVVEHPTLKAFFASLDGFNGEAILEVKTTHSMDRIDQINRDEIPDDWRYQIAWQQMCSGRNAEGNYYPVHLVVVDVREPNAPVVYSFQDALKTEDFEKMCEHMENEAMAFLDELRKEGQSQEVATIVEEERHVQAIISAKRLEKAAKKQLEDLKREIDRNCEALLSKYDARVIKADGFKLERVTRKGSIDYDRIPELQKVNLEVYRKPESSYIKLTVIED